MSSRPAALAAAGLLFRAAILPARAQQGGAASDLSFSATPYLGIAGISGSIRTPIQSVTMRAGYRHLQIEHSKAGAEIDIGRSGPITGATIRF